MDPRWLVAVALLFAGSLLPAAAADPVPLFVVYGDSFTSGYEVGGDRPEWSWATGTQPEVASISQRMGDGAPLSFSNQAFSGATVADLAAQVQKGPQGARLVVIWLGLNDVCYTKPDLETFDGNANEGFQAVRDAHPGARIIVLAVPAADRIAAFSEPKDTSWAWCDEFYVAEHAELRQESLDRLYDFNRILRTNAAQRGFEFSNATHELQFQSGDIDTRDDVHPNASGQARIAETVWTGLFQA